MNIFNGKVVAIKDGWGSPLTPGLAAGFVVRTGDKFVSGFFDGKTYTNGDLYVAATKTWAHPPVPFLANLGWKATNASIYGIGGQATRFGGRLFGSMAAASGPGGRDSSSAMVSSSRSRSTVLFHHSSNGTWPFRTRNSQSAGSP
jgi:hypothetical protein